MIKHNYLAIVVTVIVNMAVGFLWYTFLFGEAWSMGYYGITPEEMQQQMEAEGGMSPMPYILNIAGLLLMGFFLSWLVQKLNAVTFAGGLLAGLYTAIGIAIPTIVTHYAFFQIKTTVTAIDIGMSLVTIMLTAGILAAWRKK